MSNAAAQALDGGERRPSDQHRDDQQAQEWETMARAWLSAFPEAKAVSVSEVEAWIDSNHGSLPAGLQSMPRSELIDKFLAIQNYMRMSTEEKDASPVENHPARFKRTGQWIPVYSWLESLDTDELINSKDVADWLNENPTVKDDLCSRHSKYHLMHYIKKCHLKILKRREKKVGTQLSNKDNPLIIHKDVVTKQPATLPSNHFSYLPKDSDAYVAKRNEALRKYEILVELEKKLNPLFSRQN